MTDKYKITYKGEDFLGPYNSFGDAYDDLVNKFTTDGCMSTANLNGFDIDYHSDRKCFNIYDFVAALEKDKIIKENLNASRSTLD